MTSTTLRPLTRTLLLLPLALVACKKDAADKPAPAPTSDRPRFEIAVTEQGFEPADVQVPHGTPVTLVFDRKTDVTCAKQIVLDLGGGQKLERELPLNKPVEVAVAFPKAGKLTYACGMDMIKGTISVQ